MNLVHTNKILRYRRQTLRYDAVATIIRNLNEAGVAYLVVGGLAVVAHGYVRLTMNVDLTEIT